MKNGLEMEVYQATHSDIPQLVELLGILFEQEAEFQPDADAQRTGLHRIIESPDVGQILVVRDGAEVIGMVNLLFTVSTALGMDVAILEDMIVHPSHRSSGCGTRLLTAAIEFAESRGCGRVSLLTDATNARARAFYRRFGFAKSGLVLMRRPSAR